MEKKKVWAVALLISIALGLGTYWVWADSPSEKYVELRAEQIAKRLETTRHGDNFYLLFDTEYGMLENRVSYAKYISSSNGRIATFNLSLADYRMMLDNPQAMEKDYPQMQYTFWYYLGRVLSVILWVILVVWGIAACIEYRQSGEDYDERNRYCLVVAGVMLLAFLLYLFA